MGLSSLDVIEPKSATVCFHIELTYDPNDEGVACKGNEGEDGVDDAEKDNDCGVVHLVLADLVDHTESLLRYMVGHY